ncbi:MAG TPA: hypothetical protein VH061_12070 [Solirubrobacteraceae bacterium]|nr:hypothetical protein [Solirubrobacteraceae bacterium]
MDDLYASHPGLPVSAEQAINPRTDLPDRLTSRIAIQLFIEYVVITELDRPRYESAGLVSGCRWSQACISESRDQLPQVVDPRRRNTHVCKRCLQQLLQRLLRVKADEVIGNVGIVSELVESDLIAESLA